MKTPRYNLALGGSERQNNLADGVFAFAMTLLVLGLGIPLVTGTSINSELTRSLVEMWPEFLIYILSFMVLGAFWLMHHAVFDRVIYYDGTLAWFNIVFLMFVSLIPFSTALFGAYGAEIVTALVYGGNMVMLFTMLLSLMLYANSSKHRLTDVELDNKIVQGAPDKVFPELMPALYGSAYTLKFDLKKKGLPTFKVSGLRARYPDILEVPKDEWTMIIGLPIPNETTLLSQKVASIEVKLETWDYGSVAQILHLGAYDQEDATVEHLHKFIEESGYEIAGFHEEEYLTRPDAKIVKTIIRYPIKKK